MNATSAEINDLQHALEHGGRTLHDLGSHWAFGDDRSGATVTIVYQDQPATYDRVDLAGNPVGEYEVPSGWRAACENRSLCEAASLGELLSALRPFLDEPEEKKRSPFDGPFSNLANDKLSTEAISKVQKVRDGDRLLGQTAFNAEPTRTGYVARTARHAEWGDVPGQITGWAGIWHTRGAAERALRDHVAGR